MDKQAIKAFLEKPYPGWKDFMQGFVVPLFESADIADQRGANALNPDLLNLAKRSGISEVRLLAEVSALPAEFNVYDVTVSDRVCLQRNRVTVSQLVRKIVGQGSAFMVFHYKDDQSEWRLSFCQKIADAASNAKRHTFLLGEGQNVRTVTANFVQLRDTLTEKGCLEDADLIKCFDVEALSKEFFAKYKKFYEKFVDYASKHDLKQLYKRNEKAVRDYIKKMMGRLVFLQFLQKKGWLGVPKGKAWGEGDRQFLQNLFKAATPKQKDAFLDEILEHIFFHALNDSNRADGELFDTKVKAYGFDGKVKVPYLNGGLFESDQEDATTCAFPKAYFSDPDDAENNPGLLDFFSQYNFTIDENDPTEAEVGVDPEMLSCIFENLLEDNKDKGAYYTPKAIVEYMCRESLTAYLQTDVKDADKEKIAAFVKSHDAEQLPKSLAKLIDGKLRKVKICDPAIGSGAFPMGLLRELLLCRTALEDETKSAAEIKKEIIQNNIYGVDIEKGAVDIARLRFWLSLVVDEPTPAALPNLDFKIMQGNSLLESYKGVDLGGLLAGGVPEKKKKASQGKLALGKCVQSFTQGELAFGGDSAAEIITAKMREYYDESDHDKKAKIMEDINTQVKGYIKTQLGSAAPEKEIDALNPQNDKFFLWHTWFNDAFANGGFDIVIGNPPYIRPHHLPSDTKKLLWENYTTFEKKADIYVCFLERGLNLLNANGSLTYIVSDGWLRLDSFAKIRQFILHASDVRQLIDFSEDVFESATVKTCVVTLESVKRPDRKVLVSSADGIDELVSPSFVKIPQTVFERAYKYVFDLSYDIGTAGIKAKVETGAVKLGQLFDLSFGVKTGDDQKFLTHNPENPKCKKLLRGADIGRYTHEFKGEYVIYDPIAMRKNKVTARPGTKERFEQPKVLMRDTGGGLMGDFDIGDFYQKDVIIITDKSKDVFRLKVLLALLNSKLMRYFYETTFPTLHVQRDELTVLPVREDYIAKPDKKIISLVDKILAEKAKDAKADTSELESQIDTLVYDLYGLTDDEIAIVEGRDESKQEPQGETARRPAASSRRRRQATTPPTPAPTDDEVLE